MPRPQFTLRALLMAVLVAAAFFGGMAVQKKLDKPTVRHPFMWGRFGVVEELVLPDGTTWEREVPGPLEKPKD